MKNKILLWIWCFPQNLIGLIVKKVTKATPFEDYYLFQTTRGSVTIGEYIFVCYGQRNSNIVLRHEKGHRVQSRLLGWLYIPVILIPSLMWAWWYGRYGGKVRVSYYWWYTERWADKIAGLPKRTKKKIPKEKEN